MHDDQPVGISLPQTVDLRVVETEPSIKGASVSNQSKPAKLETGLVVQVPPFISEEDVDQGRHVLGQLRGAGQVMRGAL